MKNEIFDLLINNIENKERFMKDIIIYLNDNLSEFDEKLDDDETTRYNKKLIKGFIGSYKIQNQHDIFDYIYDHIKNNCWSLVDLEYFINDIDTDCEMFIYDEYDGFISFDNLYDLDCYACETDLKIFINMLKDLK